jgi:mannose-6-phosphate isomerase-like protein (cupin superfamily)
MDAQTHAIADTPLHLGLGAVAVPLDGFAWTPEYLGAYDERFAHEAGEGRLVTWFEMAEDWTSWEVHPAGEEVVLCVSGRFRLHQELDGETTTVEIGAGEYVINPPGAWHTADVIEPGNGLFITPGKGTTHRPR